MIIKLHKLIVLFRDIAIDFILHLLDVLYFFGSSEESLFRAILSFEALLDQKLCLLVQSLAVHPAWVVRVLERAESFVILF